MKFIRKLLLKSQYFTQKVNDEKKKFYDRITSLLLNDLETGHEPGAHEFLVFAVHSWMKSDIEFTDAEMQMKLRTIFALIINALQADAEDRKKVWSAEVRSNLAAVISSFKQLKENERVDSKLLRSNLCQLHDEMKLTFWPPDLPPFATQFAAKSLDPLRFCTKEELVSIYVSEQVIAQYCQLLAIRLAAMNDKQFLGLQPMEDLPSLEQLKFAAFTLNWISFLVFRTTLSQSLFSRQLCDDLKFVLKQLHERCERNRVLPSDFWTIDRTLAQDVAEINHIEPLLSANLLQQCPRVYGFEVRAEIMQRLNFLIGEVDEDEWQVPGEDLIQTIDVRRQHVLEDALSIV